MQANILNISFKNFLYLVISDKNLLKNIDDLK